MMAHAASADLVGDALINWINFTSAAGKTERNHNYAVRKEILDSWMRCRAAKVNPTDNSIHPRLDPVSLQIMLRRNREFVNIAKPFMENLYRIVTGSGFVVALTDVRGYIMEILGDQDTLSNPMTASFFQGASWSETDGGTNAIGTALIIKRPIQVSGCEHYCRKHHG